MDAKTLKLKEKLKEAVSCQTINEIEKATRILRGLIDEITKDEQSYEKFVEEELKRLKEKKDDT